jgi:outer membrane protein TolC
MRQNTSEMVVFLPQESSMSLEPTPSITPPVTRLRSVPFTGTMIWLLAGLLHLLISPLLHAQSSAAEFAVGSVPASAAVAPGRISLTLNQAIQMALQNNLAAIESTAERQTARGQRLIALSSLLPTLTGTTTEHVAQVNLATYGIQIPGVSSLQGPYQYQDARAYLSQTLMSAASVQRLRAARNAEEAAAASSEDAQEVVVLATGAAYLDVQRAASHVQASTAQVQNAEALHQQAVNALQAGTDAPIDVTRTEVQLETEQYNLTAARNDLEIAKLNLARVIGLPAAQEFDLGDSCPWTEQEVPALESLLQQANRQRADLAAEQHRVKAAALTLSADRAERLPELSTSADYGANGSTFSHSHGTFDFEAGITVPIFTGGRVKGEIEQAKAQLAQRHAEAANLQAQVDVEVRTAVLNLRAANDQVHVAHHNAELANENLDRSRNRFENGVADTVEVVQAEQSLAAANDQLITSTYASNIARLNLARAIGSVRTDWKFLLGGK